VQYHYNVGNEFYELFLSPWMMYSCAYFPTGPADLAAAQVAQLELICRKLLLRPGERLLDIGCGWGGLLVYAARQGLDATGITLSSAQADYARAWIEREGLSAHARVEICDYRDIRAAQPFDKIASIEMFGHVGRDHAPDYFASAFRVLKPGGLFLLQDFVPRQYRRFNSLQRALMPYVNFSQRYFLPDVELTPLGELFEVAEETGFEVREVESVREHYPATMRHWINRLEAQHDRAVQLTNERAYRLWRLYLAVSAYGLGNGQAKVYQTLLSKIGH
jgi:cyclopropane-fatty-acyl-phospholipid synthase